MPSKKEKTCDCCGAKLVEYRHGLTKAMVKILEIGFYQGRAELRLPFKVSDNPAFTYSQRSNFQKLRYWGLVEQDADESPDRGGLWRVTRFGMKFLQGEYTAPKFLWTFRGEVSKIDKDVPAVFVADLDAEWIMPRAKDYAREARPHADYDQKELF